MIITDYIETIEQILEEKKYIDCLSFVVDEVVKIDKKRNELLEQQKIRWVEENDVNISKCEARIRYLFHTIETLTNEVTNTLDYKNAFSDLCWQIHTERQNIDIYKSEYREAIEESYMRVLNKLDNSSQHYYADAITEKLSSESEKSDDW